MKYREEKLKEKEENKNTKKKKTRVHIAERRDSMHTRVKQ
jgi:hypothetical protein